MKALSIALKDKVFFILKIGVIIPLFYACNPTKYVPEDKYLLNSVKVEIKDKSIKPDELKTYFKQRPNKRILGFVKFHLGLYNLSNIKKDSGFNRRLREIGEAPVIFDPLLTEKTVGQFNTYMRSKGYYNALVSDTVVYTRKRAYVTYKLKGGRPYLINDIKYIKDSIPDSTLRRIIFADTVNSLIKRGRRVEYDVLQSERIRIEKLLKGQGYYGFSKEYSSFSVDTFLNNYMANIYLAVQNPGTGALTMDHHPLYKIRNIVISNLSDPLEKKQIRVSADTLQFGNGIYFKDYKSIRIKPETFEQFVYIQPGRLYNETSVDETYNHISSLKLYKMVDIKFLELPPLDTSRFNWLDCNIRVSTALLQSWSPNVELLYNTGNFGGGVNLAYQHKNLFGNAEVFDLKVKGEIGSLKEKTSSLIYRTEEFGTEMNLNFPKFLIPYRSTNFIKKYNPKTLLTIAYNYQNRPDYKRTVANFSFGYSWKETRFKEHIIRPFEMNVVYADIKPSFDSIISGTILESSYRTHLIPLLSYSYIFNNQTIKKNKDYKYLRVNAETAGFMLSKFNNLLPVDSVTGFHKLWGIQYSQYLRADFEYKYYQILNEGNNIVYRIFAGIGYPYGNAKAMPFEKQYFGGGAYSIRGWQARSIGPGSYNDTVQYSTSNYRQFPNSTGDIKLEANLEYRFKLFWVLEGALFMDAGNVWAIHKDVDRPGADFEWNKFYKDIALGSGVGLRFDFSFFLFRTDLGMKLRDPSYNPGEKWVIGNHRLNWRDHFALTLCIGYPF